MNNRQSIPAITNAEQLCELLENVGALYEISAELIAEDVFRQLGTQIDLVEPLRLCVASLDQLLPHLAKVPADIGLLNDALVSARAALTAFEVGK